MRQTWINLLQHPHVTYRTEVSERTFGHRGGRNRDDTYGAWIDAPLLNKDFYVHYVNGIGVKFNKKYDQYYYGDDGETPADWEKGWINLDYFIVTQEQIKYTSKERGIFVNTPLIQSNILNIVKDTRQIDVCLRKEEVKLSNKQLSRLMCTIMQEDDYNLQVKTASVFGLRDKMVEQSGFIKSVTDLRRRCARLISEGRGTGVAMSYACVPPVSIISGGDYNVVDIRDRYGCYFHQFITRDHNDRYDDMARDLEPAVAFLNPSEIFNRCFKAGWKKAFKYTVQKTEHELSYIRFDGDGEDYIVPTQFLTKNSHKNNYMFPSSKGRMFKLSTKSPTMIFMQTLLKNCFKHYKHIPYVDGNLPIFYSNYDIAELNDVLHKHYYRHSESHQGKFEVVSCDMITEQHSMIPVRCKDELKWIKFNKDSTYERQIDHIKNQFALSAHERSTFNLYEADQYHTFTISNMAHLVGAKSACLAENFTDIPRKSAFGTTIAAKTNVLIVPRGLNLEGQDVLDIIEACLNEFTKISHESDAFVLMLAIKKTLATVD